MGRIPPPYFCTATETGRDVIESYYSKNGAIPSHPLEHHLTAKLKHHTQQCVPSKSHTAFEVYVDDYITVTNNASVANIEQASRAMLHGIHSIFPPPSVTNHHEEDPISIKKLIQQDGMLYSIFTIATQCFKYM